MSSPSSSSATAGEIVGVLLYKIPESNDDDDDEEDWRLIK